MDVGWGLAEARPAIRTATSTPACTQGARLLPLTHASFQGCPETGESWIPNPGLLQGGGRNWPGGTRLDLGGLVGVGAPLNGHIVWLILRGGEVRGLHLQGQAADGLAWVYVDSCFFFFFFLRLPS